jgi:hypothetical protein
MPYTNPRWVQPHNPDNGLTGVVATDEGMSFPAIATNTEAGIVGNQDYDELIESGVEIAAYVVPAATWDEVRAKRNALLAGTDFHALSDVTMSDEMTAYRQALRDVPADNSDPDDISWPTKP